MPVERAGPPAPSQRALASCRERLRAAVAILSRATIVLRETVEARDRALAALREQVVQGERLRHERRPEGAQPRLQLPLRKLSSWVG